MARSPEYARQYYLKNSETIKARSRAYGIKNRASRTEYERQYRLMNKEKNDAYMAEYRKNNKEKAKEQQKEWRAKNIDYLREYNRKRPEDVQYKMAMALRKRLRRVLKGKRNIGPSGEFLGCPVGLAILIIESQLNTYPGMSWKNHGEWHLDHKEPLGSFDLTDPEQFQQAAHISNIQPLWASENLSKGDKTWK